MKNQTSPQRAIALFLVIYQILFLISLPIYFYFFSFPSLSITVVTLILYFLAGLGITAGYHRLYSHKSYKVHPLIESIILFFGTLATQGSVIRWGNDHRLHHAHVDTDQDPYSINKGFWYAHFLWLFDEPQPIEKKLVSDLLNNPLVAFQERHYLTLVIGVNAFVFLLFGWLLGDFLSSFIFVLWGRMFLLHHSTWFINSLAHTWGEKPFSQEHSAVNNYILSILTFGEGYHNYHHTFANDYRNGIKWYHFDPTKWLIWTIHKLGLASQLKKVDDLTIQKRMVIEHKRLLSDRLKQLCLDTCDELELKIDMLSNELLEKIQKWNEITKQMNFADKDLFTRLNTELNQLKTSFQQDWQAWKSLSKHILKLKPLHA